MSNLDKALESLSRMNIPDTSEEERLYWDMQRARGQARDDFAADAKVIRAWMTRYFRRHLPSGFGVSYTGSGYTFNYSARKRKEQEVWPSVCITVRIPSPTPPEAAKYTPRRVRGMSAQELTLHYYPLGGEDLRKWAKTWLDWLKTAPGVDKETPCTL